MKNIKMFILTIVILLILPIVVNASSLTNECSNYSSGDCAFCVYEFYNNDKKDFKINIALIYKSDSSVIGYSKEVENLNSIYTYGIRIQYDNSFYKDDFNTDGIVKCPTIGYETTANTDKEFRGNVFKISKDGANKLSPTSESKILKNETTNNEEAKIVCDYSSFKIGLLDGKYKVIANSSSKQIQEDLNEDDYKNGKCPGVYICTYESVNYIMYKNTINWSETNYCSSVIEGVPTNTNTGEPIIRPSDPTPSEPSSTNEIDYNNICGNESILNAVQIIGWILNFIKILVPLALIILGMVDFGKATISSDEKALSKATSSLIRRFIVGVIIFFIPTIVFALLNITNVSDESNTSGSFVRCTKCLLKPGSECYISSGGGQGGSGSNTPTGSSGSSNSMITLQ